jgi:hypothetical protein
MVAGVLLTPVPWLAANPAGPVTLSSGFFGAHSIASGWSDARARNGHARAASLYNLSYCLGSSIVGRPGGIVFTHGWRGSAVLACALALVAPPAQHGVDMRQEAWPKTEFLTGVKPLCGS